MDHGRLAADCVSGAISPFAVVRHRGPWNREKVSRDLGRATIRVGFVGVGALARPPKKNQPSATAADRTPRQRGAEATDFAQEGRRRDRGLGVFRGFSPLRPYRITPSQNTFRCLNTRHLPRGGRNKTLKTPKPRSSYISSSLGTLAGTAAPSATTCSAVAARSTSASLGSSPLSDHTRNRCPRFLSSFASSIR
jgi:hypothetical protein